ncbi:MAG: type II toxin-antitoxin system VapC family toxin [Pyrinomonadaceae bacterium]
MAKTKNKVLVDTNVFLWSLGGMKATEKLRDFFAERRNHDFYVSYVSAWEISIKYGVGKLTLPLPPEIFFTDRLARSEFVGLPIELDHLVGVHRLPLIHRDPFDRLLISQALRENMAVLTSDSEILKYDVKTIPFTDFIK